MFTPKWASCSLTSFSGNWKTAFPSPVLLRKSVAISCFLGALFEKNINNFKTRNRKGIILEIDYLVKKKILLIFMVIFFFLNSRLYLNSINPTQNILLYINSTFYTISARKKKLSKSFCHWLWLSYFAAHSGLSTVFCIGTCTEEIWHHFIWWMLACHSKHFLVFCGRSLRA